MGCDTLFWAGFGAGSAPWAIIDLTILTILFPLRWWIKLLNDPKVKHRATVMLKDEE